MKLKRVLVSNRGEIAARVIRTVRRLGLESVAVFSDADRDSLPVTLADMSVRLGPSPATESYLRVEAILDAARETGAQAIHPGYGFLSEREAFARAVEDAGFVFLGPTAENIAQLGNKLTARDALSEAGIPPVPGYRLDARTPLQTLEKIGLPLLLKATAGGGGRGIRIVRDAEELEEAVAAATSEAASAFGSSALVAERYLEGARHVEVQVLGDGRGGVQVFFERDCSTQRRLQKLVEETPSPAVDPAMRERLLSTVAKAMSTSCYRSAGTLEFLLTEAGEIFVLEMNTRIQVEHPITEITANVDLVERQLAVADGLELPSWKGTLEDHVVRCDGAAIELRVNAEDPVHDFMPTTGEIHTLRLPSGPGVRVDTALEHGTRITTFYDSLLAKVVACGADRGEAMSRLRAALQETIIGGVATTLPLGLVILEDPVFRQARNHCQYLEERLQDDGFYPPRLDDGALALVAATAAWLRQRGNQNQTASAVTSERRSAWQRQTRWGDEA
jgi:acetyl/propionyl-CoA carboxylase alpha subunit